MRNTRKLVSLAAAASMLLLWLGGMQHGAALADDATTQPSPLIIGNFAGGTDGFGGACAPDPGAGKSGKGCMMLKNDKPSGWVEGGKQMPSDLMYDFTQITFWVKSTTAQMVAVRLTDSTGQQFQHRRQFKNDGTWQQLTIADMAASMESWGGAADKQWHPPCKMIEFVLEGGSNDVAIDDVEATLADKPVPELAAKAEALAKAEKVSVGDFTNGVDGFTGSLVQDPTGGPDGKPCGKIDNNTDKWVSCGKALSLPRDVAELRFWVKSSNSGMIGVRMTDSTGQSFQNRPGFPSDGQWHEITMTQFAPAMESWGGANDKQWHGPPKQIDFILEIPQSTVSISGVEVLLAP
jgi:hypothetical protein